MGAIQRLASSAIIQATLGMCCALALTAAHGQSYPNKPIHIIVPWADGFPANSAHLFADALAKELGQPTIVEVKGGAGGEIAARNVKAAAPDGYTLLATGVSITTAWATQAGNTDPERELQSVGQLVQTPYVIVAQAGKYGTLSNFVESAKRSPGKLNYASPGIGTGMHLLGELINSTAGIEVVHVPYATGSRQLQGVLSGDVDIAIISLVTALPQIRAGKLDALAVSTTTRSRVVPNVPTLAEAGVSGIPSIGSWIALFAPKGLPPTVAARLSTALAKASTDSSLGETVASWGAEVPNVSANHLHDVVVLEKGIWSTVAKTRNIADAN